jgi:S-DNA-T family DNA segregation ATPase FtsK/SpoIIIE
VVLVDDADQLVESEVDTLLTTMAAQPEDGWGVLASGSTDEFAATYRGLSMTLRRSRCGVLLCPRRPGDGELFGIRVSRGLPSRTGSGLLAIRGEVLPIQIALTAPAAVPA